MHHVPERNFCIKDDDLNSYPTLYLVMKGKQFCSTLRRDSQTLVELRMWSIMDAWVDLTSVLAVVVSL
jgi:hypothetical protein